MNKLIPIYKSVEILKNNFLITDVWRELLSFNRTWNNIISQNMTNNQSLMISDLKQDIKKVLLLLPQIDAKNWVMLCNSCGWFPLSIVALTYSRGYLKEDVIKMLTQAQYLAVLEYDDIISYFLNDDFIKTFSFNLLIEENIYIISVILRSQFNIDGYASLKNLDLKTINSKIVPYVLDKIKNM